MNKSDLIKELETANELMIGIKEYMKDKKKQIREVDKPASGYTEQDKEYAKKKTKEMKHCDACDLDISYYAWHKHLKRNCHLKNIRFDNEKV